MRKGSERGFVEADRGLSTLLLWLLYTLAPPSGFPAPRTLVWRPPESILPDSRRSNDAGGHPQVDAIHHAVIPSQSSPLDDASPVVVVVDRDVST